MSGDTSWTVHTKSNGTFDVNYITTNAPNIKRGNVANINIDTSSFSLVQDYIEYAGSYSTISSLNGKVYYRENVPDLADVDSIVLGIEPNTDINSKDVFGIWGILDSATDNRPRALTTNQMGLNVFVLAQYSDFADHTALESELQMNV